MITTNSEFQIPKSRQSLNFRKNKNGNRKVFNRTENWPPKQRLITMLPGDLRLYFARGKVDDYCIYIADRYDNMVTPQDRMYFKYLQQLQQRHNERDLYRDFLQIYQQTTNAFDKDMLPQIANIALQYRKQPLFPELCSDDYLHSVTCLYTVLTIVYAGMVAEENKGCSIDGTPEENEKARLANPLGKRVKRLGMYQVLKLGMPPEEAAAYSYKPKDWNWKENGSWCDHLDDEMSSYGF